MYRVDYWNEVLDYDSIPGFCLDIDCFRDSINTVKNSLGDIPLTYSIKANPFLVEYMSDEIDHFEVCSPGEFQICRKYEVPGNKIIYSGVNKGYKDIEEAVVYDVDICTVESVSQLKLLDEITRKYGKKQKIILRLTSGNQFGMSEDVLLFELIRRSQYDFLDFYGIHFYSGTQKKKKQIEKDLIIIDRLLKRAKSETDYEPRLVEYGPGLGCSYFNDDFDEYEHDMLLFLTQVIKPYLYKYPIGIEMGRFITAKCGVYVTKVVDIKENDEINYVILDGGIHHLRYHGQNLAMQNPRITIEKMNEQYDDKTKHYTLCGSLCTVADVLINDIELPELYVGDVVVFHNCGAYSVTDSNVMFLSREMPYVYLGSEKSGFKCVRSAIETFNMNCGV